MRETRKEKKKGDVRHNSGAVMIEKGEKREEKIEKRKESRQERRKKRK